MRIEDNVVIMAAVILVAVTVAALLPPDLLREVRHELAAPMAQGLAPLSSRSQGWTAAGPQAVPAAQLAPRATFKPGVIKLEQAPVVRFSGVIQQLSEMPQQDGQIHLWLEATDKRELRISVAPSWFLEYTGCRLSHDQAISGVGFQFDASGPEPLIYARRLQVGGTTCQLRNDEGFALWSNRLR
ncbi:MAG: hypothetical protein AB1634_09480 [Thermodesulfobacteriota bacterium]